jgi:alkanesulfonate monooxygenase SsuD/methylene tetrahydromethanopterin reductase-like flavin-dependent oxidoreductase (luciferase family)
MVASHFTLKGASASPRPLQTPHPPIWIGANADPAIRRAARLGDCWYVNPHNRIETIVRQVDVYRRALDEYGKPFPAEFPARREVFVARSRREAIRLCAPFLSAKYQAYQAWGQDRAMPDGDNDLAPSSTSWSATASSSARPTRSPSRYWRSTGRPASTT